MKFHLKEGEENGFYLCDKEEDTLFGFGGWSKPNNRPHFMDICVYHDLVDKVSYCKQYSYDYKYHSKILNGGVLFMIKRIQVYQMK